MMMHSMTPPVVDSRFSLLLTRCNIKENLVPIDGQLRHFMNIREGPIHRARSITTTRMEFYILDFENRRTRFQPEEEHEEDILPQ
jgi:hypothetical protein